MKNELEKIKTHLFWQVYTLGIITGLALAGILIRVAQDLVKGG